MDTADQFEIVSCPNAHCGQQLRIPAGEVLLVTCPTCRTSFTHRPGKNNGERDQRQHLSPELQRKAWTLGELMLGISQESVTLLRRQAPAIAGKLDRKKEWEVYIEFLKVLFNMADRVATFYVPINEYLQFLDALEDAVIDQMNNAFRKQAGPAYDDVPVKVSIAAAFDTGQKFYQPHQFMVTEEGPERDRYLKKFGEAVATTMNARGNTTIVTTASMCAGSSIAAIKALLESAEGRSPSPTAHA